MKYYDAIFEGIYRMGTKHTTRILIQTNNGEYILGLISNIFRDKNNLTKYQKERLIFPIIELEDCNVANEIIIKHVRKNPARENLERKCDLSLLIDNETLENSDNAVITITNEEKQEVIENKENEIEQENITNALLKNNIPKHELENQLKNINPNEPEYVNINGKKYKRENYIISKIKLLRGLKCQIPDCGKYVLKKNGEHYIEAAHIEPKAKGGTETLGNILILCPNHHKEFDLGEREILFKDDKKIVFKLNNIEYTITL